MTYLERKTMREVIFESLQQYITSVEAAATPDKKKKGKRRIEKEEGLMLKCYAPSTALLAFPFP